MDMIVKPGSRRRTIRGAVITVKYRREIRVDRIDLMNSLSCVFISESRDLLRVW